MASPTDRSPTYRDAGVDLDIYQQSMARLPAWMARTNSPRVKQWENGFAGLFRLDFAKGPFTRGYRQPVLVAGSDGVGTKLKVAVMAGRHDTVGIDLVAMCVNDVLCCGAEPLFFLDYVAMGKDEPDTLEQIVRGISDGCRLADCALLGGETAIMPDLYQPGDYDLAGFHVGVVDENNAIDGRHIEVGDIVIGLASSGLHSNGFSLVRRVVFDHAGLTVDTPVDELGQTVGEVLLEPTRIYVAVVRHMLTMVPQGAVHGLAHITGGGLAENLERILPQHVDATIDRAAWSSLPVFSWLQRVGGIAADEMDRVFNMGIGFVVVANKGEADVLLQCAADEGVKADVIGQVVTGDGRVRA